MIKIVYGPAGCGKSTYVYNRIVEDLKNGLKPILIVPDQQVLSAERAIIDIAEGVSTLELEVLSFGRLSNHVFRSLGGLSFSDLDEGGRLLIMWRVLREASAFLKTYGDFDERNTSSAELMLSTVNELKQFSVSAVALEKAADKLKESYPSLSDKLYDLSFIYATYQAFLTKEYNDPTDELTRLADTLENSCFFEGNIIYFDAFDSFTPQQFGVISEMVRQADCVNFSLCYRDDDESGIFNTTERTLGKIEKLAERCNTCVEKVKLYKNYSFKYSDLAYVSENLWKHDVASNAFSGDSSHVNTISCHDLFEECEAVVGDILKKVRSGVRYKDILIIARDLEKYEGIIDTELENNGIPYFMSKRTDITTKPIFKLILAAFSIKNKNWQFNDVISYLKTGLAGVTYDECDLLENYSSAWNINGKRWYDGVEWNMNPAGFVEAISEENAEIINRANEIRNRITQPLIKFFDSVGGTTVTDITKALYVFLSELKIKEQIEEKAAECRKNNNLSEEKELIQLWNILIKALDTIVELAGDMKVSGESYVTILKIILGKTDIGTIPARVDQVILGNASMIRNGGVPHVYLIGVNEGVFPRSVSENCIFSDSEKAVLKKVDLVMSPGSDELTCDELFWFYKAVSSASEALTVTYCNSDLKGTSNKISVAGSRINFLLNEKPVIKYDSVPNIDKIQGRSSALKMLSLSRETDLGTALGEYFKENGELSHVVQAFEQPLAAEDSDIDKKLAEAIYNGNLSTSQSQVDSYVKCSFDYHCKYILKLEEKKTAVFRGNDIGVFIHEVLEIFMSRIATEDGLNTDISDDEISAMIHDIITDYVNRVCRGIPNSSPRFLQLIKRLQRTTELLVHNILEEFKQSDFIPRFFEMPISFKKSSGVEPYVIPLEDGTFMYMNGIADRVDTYKKGKDVYVRIVDYKTGTKTFSPKDIEKGLNIQLLLYLFAVWNTKNKAFKDKIDCEGNIIPAGIIYFSAKAPDIPLETEEDIENGYSKAVKSVRRLGMVLNDREILEAMEKGICGKYLPVRLYKTTDNFSAPDCLRTFEEFGELSGKIDDILKRIAKELKSGKVKAEPMETKNAADSPCTYCKMKPICRRTTKGGE